MTKGTIGLNAGTIRNLLLDGGCWSLEELKKATSLCEADLWSAIGWLARENMIQITSAKSQIAFQLLNERYPLILKKRPSTDRFFYFYRNKVFTTTLSPSFGAGSKFNNRDMIR